MSDSAQVIQLDAALDGAVEVRALVVGQDRRQYLARQRNVPPDGVEPGQQQLRAMRHGNPRHLREFLHRLAHHGRTHHARLPVNGNGLHFPELIRLEEIAALSLEFALRGRRDRLLHHHRLLARANHSVVEGLGNENAVHREWKVRALVDEHGHITRTHPDGRRTRAVGGLHQAGPARGQHQRD